jgi:hypothetical protein
MYSKRVNFSWIKKHSVSQTSRSFNLTPAAIETRSFFSESSGFNLKTTSLTATTEKCGNDYAVKKLTTTASTKLLSINV